MVTGPLSSQLVERVSVDDSGTEGDDTSWGPPALSDDGRFVAFSSRAENLVASDSNTFADVFVYDRMTSTIELVSVASNGDPGNARSGELSNPFRGDVGISDDGNLVVFSSSADSLILGDCSLMPPPADCDDNNSPDVFLHDRSAGTTVRVNLATRTDDQNGTSPHGGAFGSREVAISGNGAVVAFVSGAALVDADTILFDADVFVRDLGAGVTIWANEGLGPNLAKNSAGGPLSLSDDGTKLVYASNDDMLIASDTNVAADVFLFDLNLATISRVSLADDGSEANDDSTFPSISGDGRFVAFFSEATNLVPDDAGFGVYVRDLEENRTFEIAGPGCETGDFGCSVGTDISRPALSDDGRFVAFDYKGNDLFRPDDSNFTNDVYLYDRLFAQTFRISVDQAGGEPATRADHPALAGEEPLVGFVSFASDLVPGDTNTRDDVFIGMPQRIEALQGVANPAPRSDGQRGPALVAARELVVRVYPRLPKGSGAPLAVDGQMCIDGQIDSCPPGSFIAASGQALEFGAVLAEPDRRAALDSLSFFVRNGSEDALLDPGVHTFVVRISPQSGSPFPEFELGFEALLNVSETIDIHNYPVVLTDSGANPVAPQAALLGTGSDFVRAAYPVDEANVTNFVRGQEAFADLPAATEPARRAAERRLALAIARRLAVDRMAGAGAHVFGAGVLAHQVDGANPIPGKLGYTYRDLAGVVVTLDRDPFTAVAVIGSTNAHELGHQLGFGEEYCFDADMNLTLEAPCVVDGATYRAANPPPKNQQEGDEAGTFLLEEMRGFDVAELVTGRAALFGPPGTPLYGYMGSGDDTNSWTTPTEYGFLYQAITNPPAMGAEVVARGAAVRTVVFISGTINVDTTVELDPFLFLETDEVFPEPLPGSTYTIEFLDAAMQVIGSVDFDLSFELETLGEDESEVTTEDEVPFSLALDLPVGTETIRLRMGGTTLAERSRSANPPTVEIVSLAVGSDNVVDLMWNGSDTDSDPLTYNVLFSPDGSTLETLAVDLSVSSFSFDLDDLTPATSGAFVRVVASDGWRTGEDTEPLNLLATLDVDGNSTVVALEDGLLVLRFLFGFTGTVLTDGAVGDGCTRCDASAIEAYLIGLGVVLDIDDNSSMAGLEDGLLVLRFLFGFTGTVLTDGAVGDGCARCDAATIEAYLGDLL